MTGADVELPNPRSFEVTISVVVDVYEDELDPTIPRGAAPKVDGSPAEKLTFLAVHRAVRNYFAESGVLQSLDLIDSVKEV